MMLLKPAHNATKESLLNRDGLCGYRPERIYTGISRFDCRIWFNGLYKSPARCSAKHTTTSPGCQLDFTTSTQLFPNSTFASTSTIPSRIIAVIMVNCRRRLDSRDISVYK